MTTVWVNIQAHVHIPTIINRTLLICWTDCYESTCVPGIKLIFTLIIKEEFDELIFKIVLHVVHAFLV